MTVILASWRDRQRDFANLFNPTFMSVMMHNLSTGYREASGNPLPFPLVFIAIPFALHPIVQAKRPKTSATRLTQWLRSHPDLKSEVAAAARFLAPNVKEALRVGLENDLLSVEGSAILPGTYRRKNNRETYEALKPHLSGATFVGKWLARSGTVSDVYLSFGVRP